MGAWIWFSPWHGATNRDRKNSAISDSSLNHMDELNQLAARHPYHYSFAGGRYYRQRYSLVGCGKNLRVLGCMEVFSHGQWIALTPVPVKVAA